MYVSALKTQQVVASSKILHFYPFAPCMYISDLKFTIPNILNLDASWKYLRPRNLSRFQRSNVIVYIRQVFASNLGRTLTIGPEVPHGFRTYQRIQV